MTHKDKVAFFLRENDIKYSVDKFISYTSNIYHGFEAACYDDSHVSIKLSIEYWAKVTTHLDQYYEDDADLSVLDFGCGTGFATHQIVNSSLNKKVINIVCYDLSPEMIKQTKSKFKDDRRISFLADKQGLSSLKNLKIKFDIVICNALMHHILEPATLIKDISSYLKTDGIFVVGHEPNKLFYQSLTMTTVSKLFRLYKRVWRLFNKLISKPNMHSYQNMALLTKNEMVREGVVKQSFELKYIPKLIDIHVPLTSFSEQPWGELGFNAEYICSFGNNKIYLLKQFTYNHIKDQEAYKWFLWRNLSKLLEILFPLRGADSIFIFKKAD